MEVLLQALKIYTISRATYKDFLKLPGVASTGLPPSHDPPRGATPAGGPSQNLAQRGGKKSTVVVGPVTAPLEYTQSNVYSPQVGNTCPINTCPINIHTLLTRTLLTRTLLTRTLLPHTPY